MEPPQDLHILRVNHRDKLTDALESMYHEEALCDVTICCEHGQLVQAHRVILAACSQYFKQIFSSTTVGQYPIVFLKSITIDDLKAILEFVYKGELTVPPGQIASLIASAETLGVTGLGKINLHEQDFEINGQGSPRVNGNGSSASTSPLHGSETNGNSLSKSVSKRETRNAPNQPAQVDIQKSVPIQALPKKRGKKRKIRDEPKVEAQIVKSSVIQPTRSTPTTSKSRDSSLVRASSFKLAQSIPPEARELDLPSYTPENEFEGGHQLIQLDDKNEQDSRAFNILSRSNPDVQAQVSLSPVQANITSNGSLDLSQHSTRVESNESQFANKTTTKSKLPSTSSTSSSNVISAPSTSVHIQQQQQSNLSINQPPRKPTVIKTARPMLNQPETAKPLVPLTIPSNIKLETRSRGRPRKLITANAAVVPQSRNPLIGLARSSLAGKIAAAAVAASQISTGSPVPQLMMTPPLQPTQQARIIASPTVPPLQITSKAIPSNTPTVITVNFNETQIATAPTNNEISTLPQRGTTPTAVIKKR